jgi:hypothetical protein
VSEYLPNQDLVIGPLAVTLPGVPIGPADSTGLDLDDGVVGTGCRRCNVLDGEWFAIFL